MQTGKVEAEVNQDQLAALDGMITAATGWPVHAAQQTRGGNSRLPPLPYVSRHVVESWHIGIPYTIDSGSVVVQARAIVSLAFVGNDVVDTAAAFSAWVRSPQGDATLTIRGADSLRPFYLMNAERWSDYDRQINRAWEQRATMDLTVQYHILLPQPTATIDQPPDQVDVILET